MEKVVIHGVKYQAVDYPTYKTEFTCSDCDIYKANIPQHLGEAPMCCETEFEHINKSCCKQYEAGIKRIWIRV